MQILIIALAAINSMHNTIFVAFATAPIPATALIMHITELINGNTVVRVKTP